MKSQREDFLFHDMIHLMAKPIETPWGILFNIVYLRGVLYG